MLLDQAKHCHNTQFASVSGNLCNWLHFRAIKKLRNYQNNHSENTALKWNSYVCFLKSQDSSLERYLALTHSMKKNATKENPAIASSSQHQQEHSSLLRHKAHIFIWPRATAHPHTLWTAEADPEMAKKIHKMED